MIFLLGALLFTQYQSIVKGVRVCVRNNQQWFAQPQLDWTGYHPCALVAQMIFDDIWSWWYLVGGYWVCRRISKVRYSLCVYSWQFELGLDQILLANNLLEHWHLAERGNMSQQSLPILNLVFFFARHDQGLSVHYVIWGEWVSDLLQYYIQHRGPPNLYYCNVWTAPYYKGTNLRRSPL